MRSVGWPAPAKINRFLRITGRREDGYHLLQTVFQFLDIEDLLDFDIRENGDIRLAVSLDGVTDDDHLCLRAARALQQRTGSEQGAIIHLHKHLPIGGGLGGGSSDAATVLVALNQLWQTGLSQDELAALGLTLGADVPVFVRGHACWAEGVGEQITPVSPATGWLALQTPDVHASTAAVFQDPELKRDSTPLKLAPASDLETLLEQAGNDCEPVVRRRYPRVAEALDGLGLAAGKAFLSGTGASVFALAESVEDAADILSRSDRPGRVCRLLNRSPLLTRLEQSE